jgi:tRNA dimethylallyltransferase
MLYFRAFLEGLADMPAADPAIREAIEGEATERGWPRLHEELARVDPESAARIHPNHSRRIGRALEVYRATGITLTQYHGGSRGHSGRTAGSPFERYRVVQLAICPAERAVLHRRIEERFHRIMAAGFLEEVRTLWRRGDLGPDLPAIRAVGYRQLWGFLEGRYALNEAVERAIAATRQLAKRQLTWLRKWPELSHIYTDSAGNLSEIGLSHESVGLAGKRPLKLALNYLNRDPM